MSGLSGRGAMWAVGLGMVLGCPGLRTVSAQPVAAQPVGELCPHQTPRSGQWRVVRGYGSGPTRDVAIKAAREDAQESLRQQVAEALDKRALAHLIKNLNFTLYAPGYDPASGQACVLGIAADGDLHAELRKHGEALDDALGRLVDDLRSQLKKRRGQRLRIELPAWDGVAESDPARALRNRLLGKLVGLAGAVLTEGEATLLLEGELTAESGQRCRWVPRLRNLKSGEFVPLANVEFSAEALAVRTCAGGALAGGGLPARRRSGTTGLEVTLSTTVGAETHCGGQPYDLHVQTTRPARVRVYSVASDGRVLLGWPEVVTDGQRGVHLTRSGPAVSLHLGPRVQSGIYAVAVPVAEHFPSLGPDAPGCLGRAGLPVDRLPPSAAIHGLSVIVRPPGAPGCPRDPSHRQTHDAVLSALALLPTCQDSP